MFEFLLLLSFLVVLMLCSCNSIKVNSIKVHDVKLSKCHSWFSLFPSIIILFSHVYLALVNVICTAAVILHLFYVMGSKRIHKTQAPTERVNFYMHTTKEHLLNSARSAVVPSFSV